MFDGMKDDFRALVEEVEESCLVSMRGYIVANLQNQTGSATTATIGGKQQRRMHPPPSQRSTLFKYIAKKVGWFGGHSVDDDW
jgi:hypothetical protein